jgi:Domain of unknown function (DUF4286)
MIIYNVTSNIENSVHNQWMDWMQKVHIPAMLSTGKFFNARMVKVLIDHEPGTVTYSVQYYTNSKETLDRYYAEDAPRLRQEVLRLFSDKVLQFRTELEIISEH